MNGGIYVICGSVKLYRSSSKLYFFMSSAQPGCIPWLTWLSPGIACIAGTGLIVAMMTVVSVAFNRGM